MKDLKNKISNVLKTGKAEIGSKKVIKALLIGDPKLIILSSSCPAEEKQDILYYAKLAEKPSISVKEDSIELGSMCGKPFSISALCIIDDGDSGILASIQE